MKKHNVMTEVCQNILLDFIRWSLDKGSDVDDITVYEVSLFAKEWVDENLDEDGEIDERSYSNVYLDPHQVEELKKFYDTNLKNIERDMNQDQNEVSMGWLSE